MQFFFGKIGRNVGRQGELLKKFASAEKNFRNNYDPTESVAWVKTNGCRFLKPLGSIMCFVVFSCKNEVKLNSFQDQKDPNEDEDDSTNWCYFLLTKLD